MAASIIARTRHEPSRARVATHSGRRPCERRALRAHHTDQSDGRLLESSLRARCNRLHKRNRERPRRSRHRNGVVQFGAALRASRDSQSQRQALSRLHALHAANDSRASSQRAASCSRQTAGTRETAARRITRFAPPDARHRVVFTNGSALAAGRGRGTRAAEALPETRSRGLSARTRQARDRGHFRSLAPPALR